MIEILVNGERRQVEAGLVVTSLLAALDLPSLRVAVERNGRVVPRGSFATEPVEPGDHFEMVTLVGGG